MTSATQPGFNELFLQAPFSIGVLKGPEHVYEMANPLYLQLIGKDNILGKKVKEVLPEIVKQGFLELLDGVYKTGKSFFANEMLIKLDPEGKGALVERYLNFFYQAYKDNEGTIIGILFFATDVTEQVQSRKKIEESEKRFRQIVETAQEGIWVFDEKNKTVFVNQKMCDLLEYTQEEMIGTTNVFFENKEARQLFSPGVNIIKHQVTETYEFKLFTKTGNYIWAHVSANPIFDEAGIYKGSLAMITDITSRKQQEILIRKNLQEREILISELTKSIDDLKLFTYITCHNFRSPLSNLLGLLHHLDYRTLTDSNSRIVELFKLATGQLNETVNDLIKILIIKNNVNVSMSDCNINELFQGILTSLTHEEYAVNCEINKDLQVQNIYFNKPYLESILHNLLRNALKFSSPDRPLQICISTEQKPDGEVLMIVKDNGRGIDLSRHRDRIFGLYQRFHSNNDGAGRGLFIVKTQITALGGSIDVESKVDEGSAFYITFRKKPE